MKQVKLFGYKIALEQLESGISVNVQKLVKPLTIKEELYQVHPDHWSDETCRYACNVVAAMARRQPSGYPDSKIQRIKALRTFVAQYGWLADETMGNHVYFGLKDAKDWVESHAQLFANL